MSLSEEKIENAVAEINAINFEHPSEWLNKLKESAIKYVRSGDFYLKDDEALCEMMPDEHEKFKSAIAAEAKFHDDWEAIKLARHIVHFSRRYVKAWNKIIEILFKCEIYDIGLYMYRMRKPIDPNELIDKFCQFILPENAVVGGEWKLPDGYVNGIDNPEAPHWAFDVVGCMAYIKSVKTTDKEGILLVEYCVYRRNHDHYDDHRDKHRDSHYQHWDSGKAMVDINTHRRWIIK